MPGELAAEERSDEPRVPSVRSNGAAAARDAGRVPDAPRVEPAHRDTQRPGSGSDWLVLVVSVYAASPAHELFSFRVRLSTLCDDDGATTPYLRIA